MRIYEILVDFESGVQRFDIKFLKKMWDTFRMKLETFEEI